MSLQEITKQRQELGGVISSDRLAKSEKVIPVSSKKVEAGLGRRALSAAIDVIGNTWGLATKTPTRRKVAGSLVGLALVAGMHQKLVIQPKNDKIEELKRVNEQTNTRAEKAKTEAEIKAKIATENALNKGANERLNSSDVIPKPWFTIEGGKKLVVTCTETTTAPNPETGIDGDVNAKARPFKYQDTGAQKVVSFNYRPITIIDVNESEVPGKIEFSSMDLNKKENVEKFTSIINGTVCPPETTTKG